ARFRGDAPSPWTRLRIAAPEMGRKSREMNARRATCRISGGHWTRQGSAASALLEGAERSEEDRDEALLTTGQDRHQGVAAVAAGRPDRERAILERAVDAGAAVATFIERAGVELGEGSR